MKLILGSDHAGFKLKEGIKTWLEKKNIAYEDTGNLIFDPKDDYPDIAIKVTKKVLKAKALGILFCGSAQGMCIAANKIKGIRAVIPASVKEAKLTREHNDANVLCLSGWFMPLSSAKQIINTFRNTTFSGAARHKRRILKIKRMER